MITKEFLHKITRERPVGSQANGEIITLLQSHIPQSSYDVQTLPFPAQTWKDGPSYLKLDGCTYPIAASPFSKPYCGAGEIIVISTFDQLSKAQLFGRIILLAGEIAQEQIMPKDFPFYYPETHQQINDLLELMQPAAIIAVTGKHPSCGLDPFSMFEDGNFTVPSAYISAKALSLERACGQMAEVCITSEVAKVKSYQLVAQRKNCAIEKKKIVICAHMDTKYGTPGALDNATGVYILMRMLHKLAAYAGEYCLEFVPFNGEEYYAATGEVTYLEYLQDKLDTIALVINVDLVGCQDSQTAISTYNLPEEIKARLHSQIAANSAIVEGEPWVEGDHSIFAFRGVPTLAAVSSNFRDGAMGITHTPGDTLDRVDLGLVEATADFFVEFINSLQ